MLATPPKTISSKFVDNRTSCDKGENMTSFANGNKINSSEQPRRADISPHLHRALEHIWISCGRSGTTTCGAMPRRAFDAIDAWWTTPRAVSTTPVVRAEVSVRAAPCGRGVGSGGGRALSSALLATPVNCVIMSRISHSLLRDSASDGPPTNSQ